MAFFVWNKRNPTKRVGLGQEVLDYIRLFYSRKPLIESLVAIAKAFMIKAHEL